MEKHQKFWEDQPTDRTVEPLALKEFKNRWYLNARYLNSETSLGSIKTFGLAQNAALDLKEKELFLFWSTESGNYKIYHPDNKMVFSNQFLIDKQLIRLDYFNLTNHDFYAIIKDYNHVLSEKFRFVSEGLIDYEKISMLELKNPETNIPY